MTEAVITIDVAEPDYYICHIEFIYPTGAITRVGENEIPVTQNRLTLQNRDHVNRWSLPFMNFDPKEGPVYIRVAWQADVATVEKKAISLLRSDWSSAKKSAKVWQGSVTESLELFEDLKNARGKSFGAAITLT